jgi:hypothetical protein
MACAIAQQPTAHLRYLVLLILTDGAIMDMEVRRGILGADSTACASGMACSNVFESF